MHPPLPSLRSVLATTFPVLLAATAIALPGSASAAAPKLTVLSPVSGQPIAGQFPVKARVRTTKKTRVRTVRFYAEGRLLATDRRRPFELTGTKALDTTAMATGKTTLDVAARLSVRRAGGRVVKRWLRKSIPVTVFRPPTEAAPLSSASWNLAFADEFTSAAASAANWNTQRDDWIKGGRPYSNLEGAGYLSSNVGVANGFLNLTTANSAASGYPLSTGSVNSRGRFAFQYGYLEARVLVPSCDGCWPSFWLLASDDKWPPEIDVFEFFNTLGGDKQPWSSLHWPVANAAGEEFRNNALSTSNSVGTWHTYGLLWSKEQVQFFIDGIAGPRFDDPSQVPHEPMYPVLQLAVQAGHRPAAGSTMQVDYVRAWLPN